MDWTGLPNRSGKFGNYLASKVLVSFRFLALAFFLGAASIVAYVSWRVGALRLALRGFHAVRGYLSHP